MEAEIKTEKEEIKITCSGCGKTVGNIKGILDCDGKCWMCTNAF